MSQTVALRDVFLHYHEHTHAVVFDSILHTLACCHKYKVTKCRLIHTENSPQQTPSFPLWFIKNYSEQVF